MVIKWERYTKIVNFYDLQAVVFVQDHINPIVCAFFIFFSLRLGIDNYDTKCIVMMDKETKTRLTKTVYFVTPWVGVIYVKF